MSKERALNLIDELKDRGAINNRERGVLRRAILLPDNAPTVETKTIAKCIIAYGDGYETARRLYERPQGEWKMDSIGAYCSNCHIHPDFTFNFCPNCGADMRGNDENQV